jgi:hypothetical protein
MFVFDMIDGLVFVAAFFFLGEWVAQLAGFDASPVLRALVDVVEDEGGNVEVLDEAGQHHVELSLTVVIEHASPDVGARLNEFDVMGGIYGHDEESAATLVGLVEENEEKQYGAEAEKKSD